MDWIIVGAGAAGVFAALQIKEKYQEASIVLVEQGSEPLRKVKISGGGRCNVTHACFEPKQLVGNYPRGSKELLGPLFRFSPQQMIAWLKERGVELKIEPDGRMFPITDSSSTIIECFLQELERWHIPIVYGQKIRSIEKKHEEFVLEGQKRFTAKRVVLATGSNPLGHKLAEQLGHTIIPPVPSLFTFRVPKFFLKELSGISVQEAVVKALDREEQGPLLITHWGFSGPAILRLSSFLARDLHEKEYKFPLTISWSKPPLLLPSPKKRVSTQPPQGIPKELFKALVQRAGISPEQVAGHLPKEKRHSLEKTLFQDQYIIDGRVTHKEEFVTCGGVALKEVDFKTMQSKLVSGLYFSGEVLDIDGITGGFNFQCAWTLSSQISQES